MTGCRPLKKSEVTLILKSVDPRKKIIVLSGLCFGLRVSEILCLRFKNVSGEYLRITKSLKGSNNVTFPIPPEYKTALAELKAYYLNKGFKFNFETPLCLSQKGFQKPVSRQQACLMIRDACRSLGLDGKVNIHSFRKTFITRIYELTGKDLVKTLTYSRHKNLNSLKHYIKSSEEKRLILSLSWS